MVWTDPLPVLMTSLVTDLGCQPIALVGGLYTAAAFDLLIILPVPVRCCRRLAPALAAPEITPVRCKAVR